MKAIVPLIGLSSALALTHALAWERVLLDTYTAPQNWEITSQDFGLKSTKPFSVRMRTLHGGRQEGVCIVDIDTGAMKISVVATCGMNVLEAVAGNVRIGLEFAGQRSRKSGLYRTERTWRPGLAGRF
jgi:hypothetical protein